MQVISGVNLPMLIRIMNYPQLSLDLLADKALNAGREGVMKCTVLPDDRSPLANPSQE